MASLIKKIINRLRRKPKPSTIDDHIASNIKAALAHENEIDKKFPMEYGWCCQGCVYGQSFNDWCDKQERRLAWLSILLKKRGTEKDLIKANLIDKEMWP